MGDTWNDIQEVKNKKSSIREKLENRKRQRENLMAHVAVNNYTEEYDQAKKIKTESHANTADSRPKLETHVYQNSLSSRQKSHKLEKDLLSVLMNLTVADDLTNVVVYDQYREKYGARCIVDRGQIDSIIEKLDAQHLMKIKRDSIDFRSFHVEFIDYSKISILLEDTNEVPDKAISHREKMGRLENIENLLGAQTAKEKETKRINDEINDLLNRPSAKEQSLIERFKSQRGSSVQQFCHYGTKEECYKVHKSCTKLHFRKIIQAHTDESLGDCSFLNTCFHIDTCKYVHYEINQSDMPQSEVHFIDSCSLESASRSMTESTTLYQPQWIECDIRELDMSLLGKFAVIMADPPWDIHMELPYGTMSDDEMRRLDIPCLQTEGFLFLWVTGRAMEQGRECLRLWGYQCLEEIIWVKTNQLQRIIRTGRTGHWLNHGKEHCLVGVKGNPKGMNRGLDCDVIVSEVRETSHKPDEIYGIIERLSPGTRKLELFGRPHNLQPNWITLGNQLEGTKLVDPEVVERFRKRYPEGLKKAKQN